MSAAFKLAVGFGLAAALLLFVEAVLAVFPNALWTALLLAPPVLVAALLLDSTRRRRTFALRFSPGSLTGQGRTRAEEPAPPATVAPPPSPESVALAEAADHFNATGFPRTVAGIAKSLGPPNASIVPDSDAGEEVLVTIAWDLSWYQYRVVAGSGEPVRLEHRGQELEELEERFQAWNVQVAPDGRLQPEAD